MAESATTNSMRQAQASSSSNTSAASPPLNKACEPCRALKVRCLPGTDGPNASCQRCIKFNRTCIYAAPHRKKQRKRTDARVTELEKEILAMRALLDRSRGDTGAGSSASSGMRSKVGDPNRPSPPDTPPKGFKPQFFADPAHSPTENMGPDIVDRGIISIEEARRLLTIYQNDCLPHFAMVPIRPEQSADELRVTRPILFLALMTSACASSRPDLFTMLNTEILQIYVQRVMINGEKTLELVQAISITSAWYHPTDKWSSLKFYEYITLAATMAIDIGLGDRESIMKTRDPMVDLERKRTLIACFAQCSNVSFNLRRANGMPFSSYMAEIVDELDVSALAQPTDRNLSAFARLCKLNDDISATFSLSDAGREGQVTDQQLQHQITTFAQKLQIWKDFYRPDQHNVDLLFVYHHGMMVLHEIPLHRIYPSTWFRFPFFLCRPMRNEAHFSPIASQAISVTCTSAHAMLKIFNARTIAEVRSSPNFLCAGVTFALMMLSAISLIPDVPAHETALGGSLDFYREMTQIEPLLDASVSKMVHAAGVMEYRIPSLFSMALIRLRKWFRWIVEMRATNPQDFDATAEFPPFSIFAGPEDHPCLLTEAESDGPYSSRDTSADEVHSAGSAPVGGGGMQQQPPLPPIAPFTFEPFSDSIENTGNSMAVVNPTPGTTGFEFDWFSAIQNDYSTVLDPAMFEPVDFVYQPPPM